MRPVILTASMAFLVYVGTAKGEQCENLLTPDVTIDLTKKDTVAYLDSAMCNKSFDEFKNSYGADTAAQYFEISGKGNFTANNYNSHKASFCSSLTSDERDQSLYYRSSRIIPKDARDNYVKCVEARPLVCLFSAESDAPSLEIYYRTNADGPTKIDAISMNNMSLDVTFASQLKVGAELKKGSYFPGVKLSDAGKAARFILQTSQNGEAKPCTAYLPAPPKGIPADGLTIAQKIAAAQTFTVSLGALPGGHVGTIYQNTSLDGVYTRGTKEWKIWGPNGPSGTKTTVSYCPVGCEPRTDSGKVDPLNHEIELWGSTPAFSFNEQGDVFYQGAKVGKVFVH
jgi:hypothetical protein